MFDAWFPEASFVPWQEPAPHMLATASAYPEIIWTSITNVSLIWEGGAGMIQYRQPVRLNVRQELRYTFKKENGDAIDLTNYVSVRLQVKLLGSAWNSVLGDFSSPQTAGGVFCLYHVFATVGKWAVQFVVEDGSGNRLYGDILTLRVVENVEDLPVGDQPYY